MRGQLRMDRAGAAAPATEVARVRAGARELARELELLRGGEHTCGVPPAQCHALLEVSARGPLTVMQLAELLNLDKSSASRTAQALCRRRLLAAAADPDDRRRRRVRVTAQGRRLLARIHAAADSRVGAALARLEPDQRAQVVTGLELYARALATARKLRGVEVRRIARRDNAAVARVIRTVMPEYGAVGPGFAIMDAEVDDMFAAYQGRRAAYFVAVHDGEVIGGGGIGPLAGGERGVCELRKMYLLQRARGLGVGRALLVQSLAFAAAAGYERCYLETLDNMHEARRLYERFGFERIPGPLGNTGHCGCNSFFIRRLTADDAARTAGQERAADHGFTRRPRRG
jgi:putative acetyltransferase